MKTIATLVCVLLASQLCAARMLPGAFAGDSKVECAEELLDAVKETALYYVEQYGHQLTGMRNTYTECNALPAGEKETCLLEFGRYVIEVVRTLRPELEGQKDSLLQYALGQLDAYYACRSGRAIAPVENTNTFCAIVSVRGIEFEWPGRFAIS